jgi:flagellar biosynthetic protein FliR
VELLRIDLLLPAFGLVLARIAGLVLAAPMFMSGQVPAMFKALLVFTLSLMVFPVVAPTLPADLTLLGLAVGMAGEFLFGELLGLGVGILFFGAQLAGQVVSHQAGLALGQVFNPLYDEESTVLDQLWFFAALMVFLALRGHLALVSVVLGSFRRVPPMSMIVEPFTVDFAAGILRSIFDVALRLAGPTLLALMLTSLVLGFLARTMPQINILTVGFSFKIFVALFMVAITLSLSQHVLAGAMWDGLDRLGLLLDETAQGIGRGI